MKVTTNTFFYKDIISKDMTYGHNIFADYKSNQFLTAFEDLI